VGARAPDRRPWRRIYTLYSDIEKKGFNRNLGRNIFKNAYFLKKSCKIAAASGDLPLKIPADLQRLKPSSSDLHVLLSLIDMNLSK